MASAYQKVGDTAEEKTKFLTRFKDEIEKTGLAINDVKMADEVFINNTDKYIQALMARAKAQAIHNKAVELYEEYLKSKGDLEEKVARKTNRANKIEQNRQDPTKQSTFTSDS